MNILILNYIYHDFPFKRSHLYWNENDPDINSYYLAANQYISDIDDITKSNERLFGYDISQNPWDISYYYSGCFETCARISKDMRDRVLSIVDEKKIDLILSKGIYGSPLFLFDSLDIPIVTYSEFPSYRRYGFDEKYPMTEDQLLHDCGMDAVQIYNVLRSDLSIVPTEYVKSMFPLELHSKIVVQMDPIVPKFIYEVSERNKDKSVIGFKASSLSSSKGFEFFIQIYKELSKKDLPFEFYVFGRSDLDANTYGFEKEFLNSQFPEQEITFKEYLLDKYDVDKDDIHFFGWLEEDEYRRKINEVDIYLYPLQYGTNNWGFFELLKDGRIVIASNRCFIPEYIHNGENGFLCEYGDIDQWVSTIIEIAKMPVHKLRLISENARTSVSELDIDIVSNKYKEIFRSVLSTNKT